MPRTPCSDFWLVSTTIFAFYPYPYPSNWISIFKKIVARVHICSSTCGYGFTELACMALQKSQIPLLLTKYAAAKGARQRKWHLATFHNQECLSQLELSMSR